VKNRLLTRWICAEVASVQLWADVVDGFTVNSKNATDENWNGRFWNYTNI